MTFGEKLQSLRKQKHISQEELAIQLNISRQAISKWELNSSSPDIDNILKLSKVFDVSTDYLLNDEIISKTSNMEDRKKINLRLIGGAITTFIGFLGSLIIAILASVYPVYNTYPQESQASSDSDKIEIIRITKTGLFEFIKIHNISWLFLLCMAVIAVGIIIMIYPKISNKFKGTK